MHTPEDIFAMMTARYVPGRLTADRTYYFSVGDLRRTVRLAPTSCTVEDGKTVERADCVLKIDPRLFVDMVTRGKRPGPLDIARGRIKTNDVALLSDLPGLFRF